MQANFNQKAQMGQMPQMPPMPQMAHLGQMPQLNQQASQANSGQGVQQPPQMQGMPFFAGMMPPNGLMAPSQPAQSPIVTMMSSMMSQFEEYNKMMKTMQGQILQLQKDIKQQDAKILKLQSAQPAPKQELTRGDIYQGGFGVQVPPSQSQGGGLKVANQTKAVSLKDIKTSQVTAPRTSWTLFMVANKQAMSATHANYKLPEIMKAISDKWNALTKEEKQVYEKQAQDDLARYAREIDQEAAANGGMRLPTVQEAKKFIEKQNANGSYVAVSNGKMKKFRDPNAPKKPLTAFFKFLDVHRNSMTNKCGEKSSQVAKILSAQWRELTQEERNKWAATDLEVLRAEYGEQKISPTEVVNPETTATASSEPKEEAKELDKIPSLPQPPAAVQGSATVTETTDTTINAESPEQTPGDVVPQNENVQMNQPMREAGESALEFGEGEHIVDPQVGDEPMDGFGGDCQGEDKLEEEEEQEAEGEGEEQEEFAEI